MGILKRKVTDKKLRKIINRYLDTRQSSLWGRAYDLFGEGSKTEAAEWLEGVIKEMDEMGSLK